MFLTLHNHIIWASHKNYAAIICILNQVILFRIHNSCKKFCQSYRNALVNILAKNAYSFPHCVCQVSYSFPSNLNFCASNSNFIHLLNLNQEREQVMLEFWHYSTMVGEHFEYCTSQMPRNTSKSSYYVEVYQLSDG